MSQILRLPATTVREERHSDHVEVVVSGPSRLRSGSETFPAAQVAQNASCNPEANVGHCPMIAPGQVEGGMFSAEPVGLSHGVHHASFTPAWAFDLSLSCVASAPCIMAIVCGGGGGGGGGVTSVTSYRLAPK